MNDCKIKLTEVDGDLLKKAFFEEAKIFGEDINEAFEKIGLLSDCDKDWVCNLCFRLGLRKYIKNDLEIVKDLIDEQTPKNLIEKFGLPEQIDSYNFSIEKIAEKHKEFVGIFYLAWARTIYKLSLFELARNEYLECISQASTAREAFAMYKCEVRENTYTSLLAKAKAHKRHAETYELKEQAISHWRTNIDPKLSNPKSADLLMKVVPVSHRKLVEYIAEAKRKKTHPAG